jgi:hypothetical protein
LREEKYENSIFMLPRKIGNMRGGIQYPICGRETPEAREAEAPGEIGNMGEKAQYPICDMEPQGRLEY